MPLWLPAIGLILLLAGGGYYAYGTVGLFIVVGVVVMAVLAIWIVRTA